MAFVPVRTAVELEQVIERSQHETVVLFKHSVTCSLSAHAHHELSRLTGAGDPPVYLLVVQSSRALSDAVERQFGIRHESPQVIVLADGQPVFHASHGRVSADAVRRAVREAVVR